MKHIWKYDAIYVVEYIGMIVRVVDDVSTLPMSDVCIIKRQHIRHDQWKLTVSEIIDFESANMFQIDLIFSTYPSLEYLMVVYVMKIL